MTSPTAFLLPENDPTRFEEWLHANTGDALIMAWGGEPRGLFAALARSAQRGRTLFPGRWLAARRAIAGGEEGRILWIARNDLSLRRLFSEDSNSFHRLESTARPDDALALLGVPGDVVHGTGGWGAREQERLALAWIRSLGADRVALAIPSEADSEHPMRRLAECRGLPTLTLRNSLDSEHPTVDGAGLPLLWTDFQLDAEHRLPDESYIPGLRELLHRGSLLRERSLYDRLPDSWRSHAEQEFHALYGWHISPLLRRCTALLQTLEPLPQLNIHAPLPSLHGVTAYLLGLTDSRPDDHTLMESPLGHANALAQGLQQWNRSLDVEVDPQSWSAVAARLVPWADGGHLARCEGATADEHHFCFSGQPLWSRVPMPGRRTVIPSIPLDAEDRRALGWFDLCLRSSSVERSGADAASSRCGDSPWESGADSVELFSSQAESTLEPEQLPLLQEGLTA